MPIDSSMTSPAAVSLAAAGHAADTLSGLSAWTVTIMETRGPISVGIMVFLDNIFSPIPSELVLPMAGFTSSRGQMDIVLAIVFATVGSLIGAVLLWAVGKWIVLRVRRIRRTKTAGPDRPDVIEPGAFDS